MASRWAVGGGLGAVGSAGIVLAAWLMLPGRPGPAPTAAAPAATAPAAAAPLDTTASTSGQASPTLPSFKPSESPAPQTPEALFARCAGGRPGDHRR